MIISKNGLYRFDRVNVSMIMSCHEIDQILITKKICGHVMSCPLMINPNLLQIGQAFGINLFSSFLYSIGAIKNMPCFQH